MLWTKKSQNGIKKKVINNAVVGMVKKIIYDKHTTVPIRNDPYHIDFTSTQSAAERDLNKCVDRYISQDNVYSANRKKKETKKLMNKVCNECKDKIFYLYIFIFLFFFIFFIGKKTK